MMMLKRPILLTLMLFLAGCAGGATSPELQQTNLNYYLLDSGDRLRVTVFGQANLTGEFAVDGSGLVALPLIEPIQARGQTTQMFAQHLEAVLRQTILRNPSVSVEIAQYRPFFILGEVNQPGQYAYVSGMTVKTAAAIAGGFTYRARTSDVAITRRVGPQTIEGTASVDSPVMPSDTIQVGERMF